MDAGVPTGSVFRLLFFWVLLGIVLEFLFNPAEHHGLLGAVRISESLESIKPSCHAWLAAFGPCGHDTRSRVPEFALIEVLPGVVDK